MPSAVAASSSHTNDRLVNGKKPAHTSTKKIRVVRRRGRTAKDIPGSDDEIEREVGTDSDESDAASSFESATDSDTEPTSEVVTTNGHARVVTRSTTQSPGDPAALEPAATAGKGTGAEQVPFFGATNNWSEMVTDENEHGPAELPVIDFQEMNGHTTGQRSSKQVQKRKAAKASPAPAAAAVSVAPSEDAERSAQALEEQPVASSSRHPPESASASRPSGESARQAYQRRLDADPSFVPVVGEFWGHDDRLMDKDLRSLSGWWRGKWQGRGRGRGGFGLRGRGRGGYFDPPLGRPGGDFGVGPTEAPRVEEEQHNVPPVERAWTHDGFEEMKRREEAQRTMQAARGSFAGRGGRGGFAAARGRGTFSPRGGISPSPRRTSLPPRTWFAMKPERTWTKQYDGFLHFEPALKPRPGQGPGFRVKLPGNTEHIVRAPPRTYRPVESRIVLPAPGSDVGEMGYVVKIPKRAGKERAVELAAEAPATIDPEPVTTVEEPPIEEVFTVRADRQGRGSLASLPAVVPSPVAPPPPVPQSPTQPSTSSVASEALLEQINVSQHESVSIDPALQQPNELGLSHDANATGMQGVTSQPPLGESERPAEESRRGPPVLPPLQTSFSPLPQGSPSYGSPFAYASALPPGIAMSQHGVPYEVATGRAVYLQPAPPPHMYNPPPMMHMAPAPQPSFHPGHMRHYSTVTPEAMPAPAPVQPTPFVDPTTGAPLFTLPRQSTRVEIRAPDGSTSATGSGSDSKPSKHSSSMSVSGLRTSAAAFHPTRPLGADEETAYFPQVAEAPYMPSEADQHAAAWYPPQQAQYYYPPESYGYPGPQGYVDMQQAAGNPYEMYQHPHPEQQGHMYY